MLLIFFTSINISFLEAQDKNKYGRKGAKARKARLQIPEKKYAPDTKVYVDALWMRVHEENCPMCLLKNMKKRQVKVKQSANG